jgi:hypothetical protein
LLAPWTWTCIFYWRVAIGLKICGHGHAFSIGELQLGWKYVDMDMHFLLKSCNWVGIRGHGHAFSIGELQLGWKYLGNLESGTLRNISYVGNILENFKRKQVLTKK